MRRKARYLGCTIDKMRILPSSHKRCLDYKEANSERELQAQIVALLRSKGIEPIVSRYGVRTTTKRGRPDILFAVWPPSCFEIMACAWEVKLGEKSPLRHEQQQMGIRMMTEPNCWDFRVIRSYGEAVKKLTEMGL